MTRKQIKTYENEDIADNRQVMLEDRLQDIDNLKKITFEDEQIDTLGAKYLKMVHCVSFSDLSVYTVESPVSEHGRPEVLEAKNIEINNFLDYDVFEEVEDKGQQTIGSHWGSYL